METRFNRRTALAGLGTVTLGSLLAACADDDAATEVSTTQGTTTTVAPKSDSASAATELFDDSSACTLTAEETEGPYYFDADAIRSDIREDREGTTLRLAVRVRQAGECTPLANAVVDIWHCDALGLYSGFESASTGGGGGGGPGGGPTDEKTYLRGAQVTNADGIVEFKTIYPGWYRGRTVHIHAKVHVDKRTVLTTQLYFDDDFTKQVYAAKPYSEDTGRETFNANDNIFDERLVLELSEEDDGVLGVISFDVQTA